MNLPSSKPASGTPDTGAPVAGTPGTGAPPAAASDRLITSRAEHVQALREAFAAVAGANCREIWLCDEDFADWPLGERGVVEQLERWAASSRRLTLVARHFDEVARRHPRWVAFRRTYSHVVSCRANREIATGEFPSLFIGVGTISVRLVDTVHHRGRLSTKRADEVAGREQLDAVLQHSEETFPATTLGL